MSRTLHVLLIAPSAPPKNSPESLQVGRLLSALDPAIRVTLVTTPVAPGWETGDDSVQVVRNGLRRVEAKLPFHALTHRILTNHRLARWHIPDSDFWLPAMADRIVAALGADIPDVIYSRSAPFSAAMLAERLKQRLGLPWLMHLSDPWVASPYRNTSALHDTRERLLESRCFASADWITLTTEGQTKAYRLRYPDSASRIGVAPNMFPQNLAAPVERAIGRQLKIVYTGALYDARNPGSLIAALDLVRRDHPDVADRITVDFYGNAAEPIQAMISASPVCGYHGQVSHREAVDAQRSADILLTIEPDGKDPLLKHFMPSKNLDYIASGKAILAITPAGSETVALCAAGFGWSVAPDQIEDLAALLLSIQSTKASHGIEMPQSDPHDLPFSAGQVAQDIAAVLRRIAGMNDQ